MFENPCTKQWKSFFNYKPYLYWRKRGQICLSLSYFNIAPKLNKILLWWSLTLNQIQYHTFSETLGSAGQPEVTSFLPLSKASKKFHAVLSTMHGYQCAYSIHPTVYSLSMLIFSLNKIFNLLINALHHHYGIDDVKIQNSCFFCCFLK